MVASLPSQTITGTSAADIRASTPGTNALVETFQAADTITLSNDGDYGLAGDGADSIVLGGTAAVSLNQSVVAGFGNDTISINSAGGSIAAASFSVAGNQGADSILLGTAGGVSYSLNDAFIGGGLQNDTIDIKSAVSQIISSSIKGGDNADSIFIESGVLLTNSDIAGNKGADTLSIAATTASVGASVTAGLGNDSISIGTAGFANYIAGGAGADTVVLATGANAGTIVGGGLADSITLATGALNSIFIYGDGNGVTSAGTGEGGQADGADFIGGTNASFATGASVYGAGGADTIAFLSAAGNTANGILLNGGDGSDTISLQDVAAGVVNTSIAGGNGADTLVLTTSQAGASVTGGLGQDSIVVGAGSALTIAGGKGVDTILFTNATASNITGGDQNDNIYAGTAFSAATALTVFNGASTIDGGNGADTIATLGFGATGSILGGAGNDSIVMGTAAAAAWASNGTINGGAGVDTIVFQGSAGAGSLATSGLATGIASVAYAAGDVIRIDFTAGGTQAVGGTVNLGSSAAGGLTGITVSAAANGGLYAWSDGTDTYFGFNSNSGDAGQVVSFRVTGADLINTTAINQNVAVNTSNVSFSIAGTTTTGLSITLI